MRTYADYHIHSIYSKNRHGKDKPEDIVKKAIDIGLEEIAICDHGPRHMLYGIKKQKIQRVKDEIEALNKQYPNIKVLFGVEANILSTKGDTDIDDEIVQKCDIVLLGFHYGAHYKALKDWILLFGNLLSKFSPKLKRKMIEVNTNAIEQALFRYKIDILTHPGDKGPVDMGRIAKTAEQTQTILEINNSHNQLSKEEKQKKKD